MIYGETKIYHDGSHYVGIPHTPRPVSRKRPKNDEKIVVKTRGVGEKQKSPTDEVDDLSSLEFEELEDFGVFSKEEIEPKRKKRNPKNKARE